MNHIKILDKMAHLDQLMCIKSEPEADGAKLVRGTDQNNKFHSRFILISGSFMKKNEDCHVLNAVSLLKS